MPNFNLATSKRAPHFMQRSQGYKRNTLADIYEMQHKWKCSTKKNFSEKRKNSNHSFGKA
jgi:hypothetical protein